jgi:peptidylamidoglycolate lyase
MNFFMRLFLLLLFIVSIISCGEKKEPAKKNPVQVNYVLDSSWPRLSYGFRLSQPTGIGVDRDDHLFVFHRAGRKWTEPFPDSLISNNTILELDNETGKIINAWGANYFIMPHGLTADKENNVWVTDVGLHQVFKFDHDGNLLMKLGVAKMPGNDSLHFNLPTDVAVADDGSFYVSDGYGNSRVVKFSSTGNYISTWGAYGNKPGEFIIPHGIAIDLNHIIYVADRQNNRIQSFDTSGNFLKELKNDELVEQLPSLAIDKASRLFAIDYDPRKETGNTANGSTIFEFDSLQHASNHFGATGTADRTSCWFHDIAIDSKGNIYVGDITGLKLLKFKPKKQVGPSSIPNRE